MITIENKVIEFTKFTGGGVYFIKYNNHWHKLTQRDVYDLIQEGWEFKRIKMTKYVQNNFRDFPHLDINEVELL